MKQLIDLHFRQLGLERLQGCVSPNRRDLTSEILLLALSWSHCHCHIKEAAMVTWSLLLFNLWQLQHFWIHACLDYTLMDYSHLGYRRLDYTQLDYLWGLDCKDIWTIPIRLLVHLDYQNLDYIPNWLHCQVDYLHSDYFVLCMYFLIERLKKPRKL